MTHNSRLNSLSAIKNKRPLFKVVKTNWKHNNRPFLDTLSSKTPTRSQDPNKPSTSVIDLRTSPLMSSTAQPVHYANHK